MRFLAFLLAACSTDPGPRDPGTPPSTGPGGPMALCVNELVPAAARSGGGEDWVELYNVTDAEVALDGWSLAGRSGDVRPLPGGAVPPRSAIVLQGDRLPVGLDADGDELTLIAPDGARHTVSWGSTEVDRAWARTHDGCTGDGCWTSVWLGTPGRPNGRRLIAADAVPEWIAPTTASFSVDAPGAEALELSVSATDGARVFVDGEEVLRVGLPSGDLDREAAPLRILDAPVTARVRVDAADLLPVDGHVVVVEVHPGAGRAPALVVEAQAVGGVATEAPGSPPSGTSAEDVPVTGPEDPSAGVFARDRIHELRLELGPEAQATLDAELGTYVDGAMWLDGRLVERVAVKRRGKGGSLRPMGAKPKLRVDLNRSVPGGRLDGLGALLLDNAVQDCSSVKMPLAYDVFRVAGNPAPRSGYAHVVIDGEDKGLYYLTEEIDQRFAEEAWGDPDAAVFDGSYANKPGEPLALADFRWDMVDRFDQEEGVDNGGAELDAITSALDAWETGAASVQDVDALLDWDSWIAHFVAEEWAGHADGYVLMPNNEWIVIPADGRAKVVAWDTDQAFVDDFEWFIGTRWNQPGGRVAQLCVADPVCAERKRSRMLELIGRLDTAALHAELDALSALTGAATRADPRRECPVDAIDVYRAAVGAWIDRRSGELAGVYGG